MLSFPRDYALGAPVFLRKVVTDFFGPDKAGDEFSTGQRLYGGTAPKT